ncbi:MAG: carbohydrate ABC transporter permease [Phycisphaerae bacterium]|nr:carbohydrate ABC transporter permease [Phycisphaerae bacterium]
MATKISKKKETVKHILLLFVVLSAFLPLYLMVVVSFKDNVQFTNNPWTFDSMGVWHWENWAKAWSTVSNYLANSVVTSISSVLLCLAMAVPTAYVLARYRFPGRTFLYYILVGSMFLPGTAASLVIVFELLKNMGLVNNLLALILTGAVGGQIVCVFILHQFIDDIPKELFESARIDGAGHIQQITNIVIPMSGSVMGTLAIMQFIGSWNSLMLPLLILRDDELLTVPVGLMRLEGEYVKQWGEMMAGYTISAIPLVILFFFTMRMFVKGLTAGAIKG